jgi:PAS domain S-box-containing protein
LQNYVQRVTREKGFLETIFNSLQEGILVLDQETSIVYLNHSVERLLGLNLEEAMGQPVGKYLRELEWKKLLKNRQVLSWDLEISYPESRYLNLNLVPIEEEAELPQNFVVILYDLTATRAKTRETIESERLNALTLLAAGVAHELGNPLNSINIHFQLMERDLRKIDGPVSVRIRESVEVVRSEIGRLDMIINQFLKAVRPTAPRLKLEQINDIVKESVQFLQHEIADRDVIFESEYDPNLPLAMADRDRLKQAFYNLVKNAIQAMNTGGILRVTTSQLDTHIVVAFSDNGAGIAPENLNRLNEPYFTTKPTGSGLGLLIVRRIIQEHGGELQLESHEGRGTTVRMLLPLAQPSLKMLPPSS